MTPDSLLHSLSALPPDAALIFETEAGPIQPGYHVTELKTARVTSIDCAARVSEWTEASLQLLDGVGGSAMTVGKFSAIVAQSIRHVAELTGAPLHAEFAHGNRGLCLYQIGNPVLRGSKVSVRLSTQSARCKPADDGITAAQAAGCCRTEAASSRCCGG